MFFNVAPIFSYTPNLNCKTTDSSNSKWCCVSLWLNQQRWTIFVISDSDKSGAIFKSLCNLSQVHEIKVIETYQKCCHNIHIFLTDWWFPLMRFKIARDLRNKNQMVACRAGENMFLTPFKVVYYYRAYFSSEEFPLGHMEGCWLVMPLPTQAFVKFPWSWSVSKLFKTELQNIPAATTHFSLGRYCTPVHSSRIPKGHGISFTLKCVARVE